MPPKRSTVAHPVVWTVLYLPFGAMSGFVGVALTFLATKNGLSITEASLLNGAQFISQWLKWTWAPAVDVTLGPKRWYLIGTVASALGVFLMSAMRMSEETLPALLAVIAFASLLNSIVGMAIESIMAATTPPAEVGRTSAWFQAGNLGGAGLGGGLGLQLLEILPATWMTGAILGVAFVACGLALLFVPDVPGIARPEESWRPCGASSAICAPSRAPRGACCRPPCASSRSAPARPRAS